MSAIPYDDQEQSQDTPDNESLTAPGRSRRHFLSRKSAALAAVVTCAAGFYVGVRVEKGQLPSSTSSTATGTAATARTGAGGFLGGAGFGGTAGTGSASAGTIASVSGNTLYLTESSGNTVKVRLASSTKLTKSLNVSKSSLNPGDTIVVQGAKSSNGTITATSVSDSGAKTTSSTSAGGSSSAS